MNSDISALLSRKRRTRTAPRDPKSRMLPLHHDPESLHCSKVTAVGSRTLWPGNRTLWPGNRTPIAMRDAWHLHGVGGA